MSQTFPPGTFTPAPRRASISAMAQAQGSIETKLVFRHGEQLLLNLIIPFAILIGAAFMPLLGEHVGIQTIFPMVIAIAGTSAGFTSQAIGLAFDRRYGALKRTGASGVPAWTIIVGKIMAVIAVVAVQVLILGVTGILLGWTSSALGIIYGLITLVVGVVAFTAMGLLMGGSLSAEMVLGLANLLWLVMAGLLAYVVYADGLLDAGWWNLIPSVALGSGLTIAFEGILPWSQILILLAWAAAAIAAAVRWFRFD